MKRGEASSGGGGDGGRAAAAESDAERARPSSTPGQPTTFIMSLLSELVEDGGAAIGVLSPTDNLGRSATYPGGGGGGGSGGVSRRIRSSAHHHNRVVPVDVFDEEDEFSSDEEEEFDDEQLHLVRIGRSHREGKTNQSANFRLCTTRIFFLGPCFCIKR